MKKLISVLITLSLTLSLLTLPALADSSIIPGDADNNGVVNVADIIAIRDHILGKRSLCERGKIAADVNEIGVVNIFSMIAVRGIILREKNGAICPFEAAAAEFLQPDGTYSDDPYNQYPPADQAAADVLKTLAILRQTAKVQDYTGMTDEEIYKTIYDRYDEAFGGYFVAVALSITGYRLHITCFTTTNINLSQFGDEFNLVSSKYIIRDGHFVKTALYGTMTDDEIIENLIFAYLESPGKIVDFVLFMRKLFAMNLIPSDTYFWCLQYISLSISNTAFEFYGPFDEDNPFNDYHYFNMEMFQSAYSRTEIIDFEVLFYDFLNNVLELSYKRWDEETLTSVEYDFLEERNEYLEWLLNLMKERAGRNEPSCPFEAAAAEFLQPDGTYSDDPYNQYPPADQAAADALKTLAILRQTAKVQDYTGMTDEEIYKAIYERYDDAFGGRLGCFLATGYSYYLKSYEYIKLIPLNFIQLRDEIIVNINYEEEHEQKLDVPYDPFYHGIDTVEFSDFHRNSFYYDMTDEEILEKLILKYHNSDGTTSDFINLITEMAVLRFISWDLYSFFNGTIIVNEVNKLSEFDEIPIEKQIRLREYILNFPIDYEDLFYDFINNKPGDKYFINGRETTIMDEYGEYLLNLLDLMKELKG